MRKEGFMKGIKVVSPLFRENFKVAIDSVRGNRLRSALTIIIIAIGITSLVGIQTAIEVLSNRVQESYGKLGANSFTIVQEYQSSQSGVHRRILNTPQITYDQAVRFIDKYDIPSTKTIFAEALSFTEIKGGGKKTDPLITVLGVDESYTQYQMIEMEKGRSFNKNDNNSSSFVAIIGDNVRKSLFGSGDGVDETIFVGAVRYSVIGVAKRQGSTFGTSLDDMVLVPLNVARPFFMSDQTSYHIGVVPQKSQDFSLAVERAESIFRSVRRLGTTDISDFKIDRSDSVIDELNETKSQLSLAALVIGLITLLGAAVGLMNIMLVSVKERTREIGTRKTMGATARTIEQQFLFEAIIIGQVGGLLGIILGVAVGNVVAILMKASVAIPWNWLLISVVICLIVSILSGYVPARRAAALDPIETLRYE